MEEDVRDIEDHMYDDVMVEDLYNCQSCQTTRHLLVVGEYAMRQEENLHQSLRRKGPVVHPPHHPRARAVWARKEGSG